MYFSSSCTCPPTLQLSVEFGNKAQFCHNCAMDVKLLSNSKNHSLEETKIRVHQVDKNKRRPINEGTVRVRCERLIDMQ